MRRFLSTLAVFSVIAVAVVFLRGVLRADSVPEVMRCLSDAFSVAGILSLCVGAMTFVSRNGVFDAFGYTLRCIWVSLHGREYREKNRLDLAEYQDRKRKSQKPYRSFFAVGLIFMIPAVIFTVLFYIF